jgi:hypothetical protein
MSITLISGVDWQAAILAVEGTKRKRQIPEKQKESGCKQLESWISFW